MKKCIKCNFEGEEKFFAYKCNICKTCRNEEKKQWYLSNKEKLKDKRKKHYLDNKEKVKAQVEEYRKEHYESLLQKQNEYYQKNKEKIIAESIKRYKKKYKSDDVFRFSVKIRSAINHYINLKHIKPNKKIESILGCTIEEFIAYIESKFEDGMSWENRKEWHIDHIIPISSATTEEEVIKLNHYTNLQPLWARENIIKSNKKAEFI